MFGKKRKAGVLLRKRSIGFGLICLVICLLLVTGLSTDKRNPSANVNPTELIRFHVLANSDSEEDQMLKLAVRDRILQKLAPRLADASSLAESREIIKEMEGELIYIAEQVVSEWGKNYPVSFDYGRHLFPTKSYGNIVLPGGEYEAVKIKIGQAEGANWWCILFPPLCFVNVEESTTIEASGSQQEVILEAEQEDDQGAELVVDADKQGRLMETGAEKQAELVEYEGERKSEEIPGLTYKGKKVGFFLLRFFR